AVQPRGVLSTPGRSVAQPRRRRRAPPGGNHGRGNTPKTRSALAARGLALVRRHALPRLGNRPSRVARYGRPLPVRPEHRPVRGNRLRASTPKANWQLAFGIWHLAIRRLLDLARFASTANS